MLSFVEPILFNSVKCLNIVGDTMNIYYTENTLYINMNEEINMDNIDKLRKRVFGILDDYDINNIVLSVITNKNNILLDEFIEEYHRKYNGNITLK